MEENTYVRKENKYFFPLFFWPPKMMENLNGVKYLKFPLDLYLFSLLAKGKQLPALSKIIQP